jgi:hypothetical protein
MWNNLENINFKETIDSEKLLSELLKDIESEYWVEKETLKKLIWEKIWKETSFSLEWLKNDINSLKNIEEKNKLKLFKEEKLEKLFYTLKWAKEIQENISYLNLKNLQKEIKNSERSPKNLNSELKNQNKFLTYEKKIEKYLPINLISNFKNPKNLHWHIWWFALGTANSIFTTTQALYNIWTGIIKTPFHLYLILSWKAKIDLSKI